MDGLVSCNCVKSKNYWSIVIWNAGEPQWLIATGIEFNVVLSPCFIHVLVFQIYNSRQMYGELQLLSALVPTRKLYFLRFVQQIEAGSWVIADVSYDIPNQDSQFSPSCRAHLLPSGCLIQEMPNGYSKVA